MDQKNVETICKTVKWGMVTFGGCYLGKKLIENKFNFSLKHKDIDFSASPSSKDQDASKER